MPLPTFIIAGAPKCGTTALWMYLKEHPEVYMTNPIKEPRFFSDARGELEKAALGAGPIRSGTFHKGLKWYESLFTASSDKPVRGEGSTQYFSVESSPKLIKSFLPDVKLIFLLRDPSERVYSHYWQEYKLGLKFPTFANMVKSNHPRLEHYCHVSCYKTHLKRYYDVFSNSHILVLLDVDLRKKPLETIQKAYEFVGVDTEFVPSCLGTRFNKQMKPRLRLLQRMITNISASRLSDIFPDGSRPCLRWVTRSIRHMNLLPNEVPPLPKEIRAQLRDRFLDDIAYVEELQKCDLNAWRK